jgi:hypothetical protein
MGKYSSLQIYEDSLKGMTPKDIAETYGLSVDHVHAVIKNEKHLNSGVDGMPSESILSLRRAIEKLDISEKCRHSLFNTLRREGVDSLDELKSYSRHDMEQIRGVGRPVIKALESAGMLKADIQKMRKRKGLRGIRDLGNGLYSATICVTPHHGENLSIYLGKFDSREESERVLLEADRLKEENDGEELVLAIEKLRARYTRITPMCCGHKMKREWGFCPYCGETSENIRMRASKEGRMAVNRKNNQRI